MQLTPTTNRNIIINENSLVIQKVDKLSAGKYVCEATNRVGSGSSDEVQLNIKCTKNLIYFQYILLLSSLSVMEN